ncbi:hypothetical protein NLM24_10590 [Nocardia zapadnayensis]|nr:hypothetical protein [Nocardia zapadnayensis]MCX0271144.1 hypothetical protein [Nocardia zapadnayensis]
MVGELFTDRIADNACLLDPAEREPSGRRTLRILPFPSVTCPAPVR